MPVVIRPFRLQERDAVHPCRALQYQSMLEEMRLARLDGGPERRWFADEDLDLIVWLDARSIISGFQLCYDRRDRERALTWTRGQGYFHSRVDDGESGPNKNQSPILIADGTFDAGAVVRQFRLHSKGIPARIRKFVLDKLRGYPA